MFFLNIANRQRGNVIVELKCIDAVFAYKHHSNKYRRNEPIPLTVINTSLMLYYSAVYITYVSLLIRCAHMQPFPPGFHYRYKREGKLSVVLFLNSAEPLSRQVFYSHVRRKCLLDPYGDVFKRSITVTAPVAQVWLLEKAPFSDTALLLEADLSPCVSLFCDSNKARSLLGVHISELILKTPACPRLSQLLDKGDKTFIRPVASRTSEIICSSGRAPYKTKVFANKWLDL